MRLDVLRGSAEGLLTTGEMAARANFQLGGMEVSPATRSLRGPLRATDVEPRVMQVLVVLADAAGSVVTRDTLFRRCWGGAYVGDDSLNRAIAGLRRSIAAAGGTVDIETVPRTGYRLSERAVEGSSAWRLVSRRTIITGTTAAVIASAGGLWWLRYTREEQRFSVLLEQGKRDVSDANSLDPAGAARLFELAVRLRPNSAEAWGWLAYARTLLTLIPASADSVALVDPIQDAARHALAIDFKEPNALLALLMLQGSTLDWWSRDQKLREILSIDPQNVGAISEMVLMLQAAGFTRESWNWNERALKLQPFSQDFLGKRALKLWIANRFSEADKVSDQLRALFPASLWVWWVRFLIFAMTGRALAAREMLQANTRMMVDLTKGGIWPAALEAMIYPSSKTIGRARRACFDAAKTIDPTRGEPVMILCALGEVDAAFEVANGLLLSEGPIIPSERLRAKAPVQNAVARINMQWMFTPPCRVMRVDRRFLPLCDGIGLMEYWRRRGVKPDYMLQES